MALEARNAAWDVEREIDREVPAGSSAGSSGPRADFLANLGRRVAELSSMLGALEREPGSSRLRDDLRRRLHALGAGARLLKFERLSAEVAAAEDLLGEVAERGELAATDAAALRAALGKLPALGWTANEAAGAGEEGRAGAAGGVGAAGARGPAGAGAAGGVGAASGVGAAGSVGLAAALAGAGAAGVKSTLIGVGAAGDARASTGAGAQAALPPNPWPLSILVVGPKPIADALVVTSSEGATAIDVERTEDGLRAIDLARAVAPDVIVIDTDRKGARELIDAVRKDPLTATVAIVALGTWGRAEDASPFLTAGATRAVHKPVSPDALRRVCREASADREGTVPSIELGRLSLAELAARLGKEVERAIVDGAAIKDDETRIDLGRGEDVLSAVWSAAGRVRDVLTIKSRGEIRFAPGAAERAVPVGAWMNEGAASGVAGATPARRGGVRVGPSSAKALAGARVLVADDDPAVAWFLAGVLRAEGATVIEACDGAVALRKAMEQAPDVVLSDVLMPNLDGLTLTELLRSDPILSDVAVVLLSWKDDLLQRARELGSRADGYLRKDASGPTVATRVRELMYPKTRLAERIAAGGEVHGRVDGLTMRTLLRLVCTHRPASLVEVRDAAYLYEIEIEGARPTNVTRTAKDGTFVSGPGAFARMLGVRAGRFVVAPPRAHEPPRPPALTGTLDEQIRPHAAASRGAVRLLTGPALGAVTRIGFDDDWLAGYGALAPEPARSLVRRLAAGEPPRRIFAAGLSAARAFEEVVLDASARGAITSVTGTQGEEMLAAAVQAELAVLLGARPVSVPPPAGASAAGGLNAIPGAGAASGGEGEHEVSPSGVHVAPAPIVGEAVAPAPGLLASAAADDLVARGAATAMPPSVLTDGSPSVDVDLESAVAPAAVAAHQGPLLTLGSLTPPPAAPRIEPRAPRAPVIKVPREAAIEEEDESPPPRRSKKSDRSESRTSKTPEAPAVKSPSRVGIWVMCAVAGIVFAVGARISQDRKSAPPVAPPVATFAAPPTTTTPAAPPAAASSAAPAAKPTITVPGESPDDPILPQEAPLRSDEKIPSGQGLLEVVVGPTDEVSIDGQPTVAGPVVKATLAPREKPYEIKVKLRGEERLRFATIKEGKRTRVRIAPPWNR